MKKFNKAAATYPEAYEEVAGRGFTIALRLLDEKLGGANASAFLAKELQRDVIQIDSYRKIGIPHHLGSKVMDILRKRGVRLGIHQLVPTMAIVESHIAQKEAAKASAKGG